MDAIARKPWWHDVGDNKPPDFVIGKPGSDYLRRWYLVPRNPFANAYLHCVLRSDDDRALHDHPWPNLSIILEGRYIEHTIRAGGVHRRAEFTAGDWKLRRAGAAHRLETIGGAPCWTLFITGPRLRTWGFHCADRWVPWQEYTAPHDSGQIGRGCD